jgi:hypothetical protein
MVWSESSGSGYFRSVAVVWELLRDGVQFMEAIRAANPNAMYPIATTARNKIAARPTMKFFIYLSPCPGMACSQA